MDTRSKAMWSLGILREGPIKTRILRLYEAFGSCEGRLLYWNTRDLCVVIGVVGPDGEPSRKNKNTVSRARRALAAEGRLRKVSEVVSTGVCPPITLWGWAYVPDPDQVMSQEALDLLSARTPGITWK